MIPKTFSKNFPMYRIFFWLSPINFRGKLFIFSFILSTLPVLLMEVITSSWLSKVTEKEVINKKQDMARLLVDNTNRFMLKGYQDIQILSRFAFLQNSQSEVKSREQIQGLLNNYLKIEKSYESIAVFDINGNLIVESKGQAVSNQQKEKYFQTVLKTNKPYISQPLETKSLDKGKIYLSAPVKDSKTDKTLYIIRITMPLQSLQNQLIMPENNQDEFYLIDSAGKVFLSNTGQNLGRNAKEEIPEWEKLQAGKDLTSEIVFNQKENSDELVTYVPWQKIEDLPNLEWKLVLSRDAATAFATSKELLLPVQIGTLSILLLIGTIAAIFAKSLMQPILTISAAVKQLSQGNLNTRLSVKGDDEISILVSDINQIADQLQESLQKQTAETEQLKSLTSILSLIHSCFNTKDLFNITVTEARKALSADRIIVYQLDAYGGGKVIAESVNNGLPVALKETVTDSLINTEVIKIYTKSRVFVSNNVKEAGFSPEHLKLMERLQVKANLVTPIFQDNHLFGFLMAHSCRKPHVWKPYEVNFLSELATQVGLALKCANLLDQTQKARQTAETASLTQNQQKEELQIQLLQLIDDIERAQRGDLTVRTEATDEAIGTLADFFNSIMNSLRQIVTSIKVATTQVSATIENHSGLISQVAVEVPLQAEKVNRTLHCVDEMTLAIEVMAKNAKEAAEVVRVASLNAETGGKAIDYTVENIWNLQKSIAEIEKKVKILGESLPHIFRVAKLMSQITLQTNLLAINAGIEARRGAQENQALSVIAKDVAVLAEQSTTASSEIEEILARIQLETNEAVKAIEWGNAQVVVGSQLVMNTKQSLSEIINVCHQIENLVQTIYTATVSQAKTSQEVGILIQEIAQVSEMTNNSFHQISSSLEKTLEISQQLQAGVSHFKLN
jgi:methyl-accepting chemotaxis protein PixJ